MKHPTLSILIPAAGGSQRLGQAKQLIKYRGNSLLQHAINRATSLCPLEIIVVTGTQKDAVKNTVKSTSVNWVHNPDWAEGLGGSVAAGAACLAESAEGLMVLLCDQWFLQTDDLTALAQTWAADKQRIVAATANGQTMPPVIFPANQFEQLRKLEGKHGAKRLLMSQPELLKKVPMPNAAFDLDNQQHLDHLLSTP